MAGIGFELRKVLQADRILSLTKVYGYSAVLSSGPWAISILAIILIGFIDISSFGKQDDVSKYQVVITYGIAFASSLIVTGVLQLPFTRYIADLIFKKREDEILPSYFGALFLAWSLGLIFVIPFYLWVFDGLSYIFIIGAIGTFLVLCGVWISSILAASLKYYKSTVGAYFISYALIVIFSYIFGDTIESLTYI
jgi:uncharacterized membrane protein